MGSVPDFNLDADNFEGADIRSLQTAGDSGNMRVRNSTKVDGASYDGFTGGFANTKWDILTYE